MIMQHLLVDLKKVARRKQKILPKLQSGLMHPIQATKFVRNTLIILDLSRALFQNMVGEEHY
jgi:hypothetical protein